MSCFSIVLKNKLKILTKHLHLKFNLYFSIVNFSFLNNIIIAIKLIMAMLASTLTEANYHTISPKLHFPFIAAQPFVFLPFPSFMPALHLIAKYFL